MGFTPMPGERALILAGPLASSEGVVRSVEGTVVTLDVDVFDRHVAVEVDAEDLGPPPSSGGQLS